MNDILSILETAASEIRTLRERADIEGVMRANHAVRIAISQMRGNRIDCTNADKSEWDTLNRLIDAGRVHMDHSGEMMLGLKVLTRELLHAEMTQK